MWGKKTVAVIISSLEDNRQVHTVIQDFDATGYVDEILIVGSSGKKNTQREIEQTRAKLSSAVPPFDGYLMHRFQIPPKSSREQ